MGFRKGRSSRKRSGGGSGNSGNSDKKKDLRTILNEKRREETFKDRDFRNGAAKRIPTTESPTRAKKRQRSSSPLASHNSKGRTTTTTTTWRRRRNRESRTRSPPRRRNSRTRTSSSPSPRRRRRERVSSQDHVKPLVKPGRRERRLDSGISSGGGGREEEPIEQKEMIVLDEIKAEGEEEEKSRSRESSLSLSLSPSPEREPPRASLPDARSLSRQERHFRFSRSPPRRYGNHFQRRSYPDDRRGTISDDLWAKKVETFLAHANGEVLSKKPELEVKKEVKKVVEPLPPGAEEEEANADEHHVEDLKSSPLIRYIGKKLTKRGQLKLNGFFQYNLVSLLTRGEWIAARTLLLFEEFGYQENSLYFTATAKGGPALENELKSLTFSNKFMAKLDSNAEVVNTLVRQVLLVIEFIVSYFTSQEEDISDEDNLEEDATATGQSSRPLRSGVGDLLKGLAEGQSSSKTESDTNKKETTSQPILQQQQENPWTDVEDRMQSNNLNSLLDMETFIAKDLLRLDDKELCGDRSPRGVAFDVAKDMVVSLAIAGYNHGYLVHLVMQTPVEDILLPKDVDQIKGIRKQTLHDQVLTRLIKHRAQFPNMSDKQLDYLVRKCLLYVMNGCNKKLGGLKPPSTLAGCNIVFNYLPEGLRELENKSGSHQGKARESSNRENVLEEGETPQRNENNDPENKISTDPLNSILNPEMNSQKPNELPKRQYMVGCFHLEWVMLNGVPHVYEISIYMSDMTSMNIYCLTDSLQKHPDIMRSLGFVANPIVNKFYFTQVGIGCVEALPMKMAVEKLAGFLDAKRNSSTSENKNNGLILNGYSEEELAVFMRTIESHRHLLIDTVKGFGCVQHFIERNRARQIAFSEMQLSEGGRDCFFSTDVKKELKSKSLVSKSKGEAMLQALEFFLDDAPNFTNYFFPFCFPSFSPKMEIIKRKLTLYESMFLLEIHLAAELKNMSDSRQYNQFSEVSFPPMLHKELRDVSSVISSQFCRLLVNAGLDHDTLKENFRKNTDYTINKSVILDKISGFERLPLVEQTLICISIVKDYFMLIIKAEKK